MSPQAPTRKIFNAATQQVEDAVLSVDSNNEIIATFSDGHFVKFPAGLTKPQFEAAITAIQKANEGQEVITPEMQAAEAAARANSLALIGAAPENVTASTPTGNDAPAAPEGDITNAPTPPAPQASN